MESLYKGGAYTLGFLIAFGALAELIEMAGGISGFSQKVEKWAKSERGVLGWGWLLSIITLFDSSFHTIAVGTVLNPLHLLPIISKIPLLKKVLML